MANSATTPPSSPSPEMQAFEQDLRAKLHSDQSSLYQAKADYLGKVREQFSKTAQYQDQALLNAKMQSLEKDLDNRIVETALKGASEGGKPAVYENATPTAMEGVQKKIANNLIEKIFSYLPFGQLLYDVLSKFIDVDAITEGVRGMLGMAPKYTKEEKIMAGALDALQNQPISLQVGQKFVLTPDQAAAVYDQRQAQLPPTRVNAVDNNIPDGTPVTPSATPTAGAQKNRQQGGASPAGGNANGGAANPSQPTLH